MSTKRNGRDLWWDALKDFLDAGRYWTLGVVLLFVGLIAYLIVVYGLPAVRNAVISEAVGSLGVTAWHEAGFDGRGERVGLIAVGFENYRRLVYRELPGYWSIDRHHFGSASDEPLDPLALRRGTALGEVLFDILPRSGAEFYSCGGGLDSVVESLGRAASGYPTVTLLSCDLGFGLPRSEIDRLEGWIGRMRRHRYLIVVPICGPGATVSCCVPSAWTVGAVVGPEHTPMDPPHLGTPDFVAPGTAPTVTFGRRVTDGVYPLAGADVAAAYVAAVAALVWQAYPKMTIDELEAYLAEHAIDLGEPGFDNVYGHGLVRLPAPPSGD